MIPEWLLAPIDAGRPHQVDLAVAWHARMMTLAWGVLVPAGVLIARYFKVTPRQDWPRVLDNQFWWVSHLWLQQTAAALMLLGVVLTLPGAWEASIQHAILGWLVVGFACLQILSGWLRGTKGGPSDPAGLRGDHYDMTRRRLLFEAVHKVIGYALLPIAAATIMTGLWSANAPVWMWIVIPAYWIVLIVVAVVCERRGMNMGSYQAIWGPDKDHPGNR
ncbi:cytochrome b561 domain-containing protein [Hoeflea sp.]|uniref:cytochrome b561 domain-containing protein n=1 Tax=Hoeflea sp. TaxID=1940281 RepID=UPI003B02AF7E